MNEAGSKVCREDTERLSRTLERYEISIKGYAQQIENYSKMKGAKGFVQSCTDKKEECEQIVKWLKELKARREADDLR